MRDGYAAKAALLLDRARSATGLHHAGTGYEEGLRRFLEALDAGRPMSQDGRAAVDRYITGLFACRLKTIEAWRRNPGYRDVTIDRPIVITGIPRTGTTALHKLMSMDPQFQGIELWLTHSPKPRPPRQAWTDDADFVTMQAQLAAMAATAPNMLIDHDMRADDVDESLQVLQHTFICNAFPSQWAIPSYDRWYRSQDETDGYRWLADVMRLIGLHDPNRIWLLKNPTDTRALDAVINAFPDVRVIQTHRDPVQAVPSLVHLLDAAWPMFNGQAGDPHTIIEREAGLWAEAVIFAKRARARLREPAIDVEYRDFVTDQLGTVRRLYTLLGLVLDRTIEARMLRWLDANPRRPGTLQRHTAEAFGMAEARLRAIFANYREERGYS